MPHLTDSFAQERARKEKIPDSLHVPIAAVDEDAIQAYVGNIDNVVISGTPSKAILVSAHPHAHDETLLIWDEPGSELLFRKQQIWVHVDYNGYRYAYKKALPNDDIDGLVLSHAMGRRLAKLLGFSYVRLEPVTRAENSSSVLSEKWGYEAFSSPSYLKRYFDARPQVRYADTTELLLLMRKMIGGGIMEAAYYAEELFKPKNSAPLPILKGSSRDSDYKNLNSII